MLTVKNMHIELKSNIKVVVDNISFSLHRNDKMALIGEEGNGKSTLLKSIYNKELVKKYAKVSGEIITSSKIGYLEQDLDPAWENELAINFILKKTPDSSISFEKYNKMGYILEQAKKFNLEESVLDRKLKQISGGEKIKIQLIKVFFDEPEILFLDEPTNDLDISTLKWLEQFIKNTSKPIIFISHDETLLEKTATSVLHLEQTHKRQNSAWNHSKFTYKEYLENRKSKLEKQEKIALKQRETHKKQMQIWNKMYSKVNYKLNSTKNDQLGRLLKKKMKNIKSQEKRFDVQEKKFEEMPDVEEAIEFRIPESTIHNKKKILDLDISRLKISRKVLSKNIQLNIKGNDKIFILGKNGVGKTTLIVEILKQMKTFSASKFAYMPQNYADILNDEQTVLEYIESQIQNIDDVTLFRSYLGSLKFSADELDNKVHNLSGGQKAKLILATIIFNKPDVIILDEPTRNLSPLSTPVIIKELSEFNGCIICVSHDRKLINGVSNKIFELNYNGLKLIKEN